MTGTSKKEFDRRLNQNFQIRHQFLFPYNDYILFLNLYLLQYLIHFKLKTAEINEVGFGSFSYQTFSGTGFPNCNDEIK